MTAGEVAAFEAKYGYKVSSFRVAVDALAVYVNKDNPIPCLTLPQLSGIFSSNRMAPGSADIKTWSDLGLTGEWTRQPITLYSRNTLSGTFVIAAGGDIQDAAHHSNCVHEAGSTSKLDLNHAGSLGNGWQRRRRGLRCDCNRIERRRNLRPLTELRHSVRQV
jgi:phosphate transport system substrate-binding protein